MSQTPATKPTPETPVSRAPTPDRVVAQLSDEEVLDRASRGDTSLFGEMERVLDSRPGIWRKYGDLARLAEARLIKLVASTNYMLQESLLLKVASIRKELAGPSPTPMEELLALRISTDWLTLSYLETLTTQPTNGAVALNDQVRKHIDSAHKRYLAGMKQLALIRKLLPKPTSEPLERVDGLERFNGRNGYTVPFDRVNRMAVTCGIEN